MTDDDKVKRKSVPESTKTKAPKVQKKVARMSCNQYVSKFYSNIDKYKRSYFESIYRGILKSKDDWKKELDGKIQGGDE